MLKNMEKAIEMSNKMYDELGDVCGNLTIYKKFANIISEDETFILAKFCFVNDNLQYIYFTNKNMYIIDTYSKTINLEIVNYKLIQNIQQNSKRKLFRTYFEIVIKTKKQNYTISKIKDSDFADKLLYFLNNSI